MILAWIVYALAVGALLSVAAWASERLLRSAGRQGRWAWVAAGIASLLVPLLALTGLGPDAAALIDGLLALGEGGSGAVELPAATVVTETSAARVEGGWSWSFVPSLSQAAELGLVGGWLLASVLVLGVYALTWRRLRRRMARWPQTELEGSRVRLTRATGPAVVGILRPVMMVPAWIRDLPPEERGLVLRHEREHLRAGDSRLLALFPLLVALAPWNLPLWWQLRRLRLAVELDCDARVLADGNEAADYGRLLVSMSRGPESWIESGGLPLTTAALVERRSDLETRIRTMIEAREKPPVFYTATLAALAGLTLFVACDTPAPVASDTELEADAAETSGTVTTVGEALGDGAPLVVVDGVVQGGNVDMEELKALDIARIEVVKGAAAEELRGERASDGLIYITTKEAAALEDEIADVVETRSDGSAANGRSAGLWMVPTGDDERAVEELPPPPQGGSADARPSYIPREVDPRLTNAGEIEKLLERRYPSALRDAGISGRAVVWLLVDATGDVETVQLQRSSGLETLDRAAMDVARSMEFEPARDADGPLGVWISQPVSFRADPGASTGTLPEREGSPPAPTEKGTEDRMELREIPADSIEGRIRVREDDAGDGNSIQLRGIMSVGADGAPITPLVIIDGVVQGDAAALSDLDPSGIHSIEIVKGAAARELYGDRAADGVIHVTTEDEASGES